MLRGLRCLLGRVLRRGRWCLLARLRGGRRVLEGLLSVPLGCLLLRRLLRLVRLLRCLLGRVGLRLVALRRVLLRLALLGVGVLAQKLHLVGMTSSFERLPPPFLSSHEL